MDIVFIVLTVQALMGAFDNLWHHEWSARLPQRTSARHELLLHAAREAIYGVLFLGFAWVQWQGWWVLLPTALLAVEIVITAADFLEEDRSRRLPPAERVLHTLLAVSYGVLVGVIAPCSRRTRPCRPAWCGLGTGPGPGCSRWRPWWCWPGACAMRSPSCGCGRPCHPLNPCPLPPTGLRCW